MTNSIYVERRAQSGAIIERVGPLPAGSVAARTAIAGEMHIAQLHNRSRRSDDASFQMVYEVDAAP